jgi:hypothetical protein
MDANSRIGSILGDFVDAVIHPSVTSLPMGFLVLVLAVLTVAALPEGARERMRLGRPDGVRADRQPLLVVAGQLGCDPALSGAGHILQRFGRLRAAVGFYDASITDDDSRQGVFSNAAKSKAMKKCVAARRAGGAPGQVVPEAGHRFARRIWELDPSVWRRRLRRTPDEAGQDGQRTNDPHRAIPRSASPLSRAKRQSGRSRSKPPGWPQPDPFWPYLRPRAPSRLPLDLQAAFRFRNRPSSAAERAI